MITRPWILLVAFAGAGRMAVPVGSAVAGAVDGPDPAPEASTAGSEAPRARPGGGAVQRRVLTAGAPPSRPVPFQVPAASPPDPSKWKPTGSPKAEPSTRRTPLELEGAARLLSDAWRASTGHHPSSETLAVLLAHWAFETGRGDKMIGYNFAGLKGTAPGGGSARLWTHERHAGQRVRVLRTFRVYRSARAGANDYVTLLDERYSRAFRAAQRGSVLDFVQALEDGGYFTDDADAYRRAMRSLWMEFVRTGIGKERLEH